jgi:hypothetical protein
MITAMWVCFFLPSMTWVVLCFLIHLLMKGVARWISFDGLAWLWYFALGCWLYLMAVWYGDDGDAAYVHL